LQNRQKSNAKKIHVDTLSLYVRVRVSYLAMTVTVDPRRTYSVLVVATLYTCMIIAFCSTVS